METPQEIFDEVKSRINEYKSFDNEVQKLLDLTNLNLGILSEQALSELILMIKTEIPDVANIDISNNKLLMLPDDFSNLNLRTIIADNNDFDEIPNSLRRMENLSTLRFDNNPLKTIPTWISELRNIEVLNFENCNISTLPDSIYSLPKIRSLNLSRNYTLSVRDIKNLKSYYSRSSLKLSDAQSIDPYFLAQQLHLPVDLRDRFIKIIQKATDQNLQYSLDNQNNRTDELMIRFLQRVVREMNNNDDRLNDLYLNSTFTILNQLSRNEQQFNANTAAILRIEEGAHMHISSVSFKLLMDNAYKKNDLRRNIDFHKLSKEQKNILLIYLDSIVKLDQLDTFIESTDATYKLCKIEMIQMLKDSITKDENIKELNFTELEHALEDEIEGMVDYLRKCSIERMITNLSFNTKQIEALLQQHKEYQDVLITYYNMIEINLDDSNTTHFAKAARDGFDYMLKNGMDLYIDSLNSSINSGSETVTNHFLMFDVIGNLTEFEFTKYNNNKLRDLFLDFDNKGINIITGFLHQLKKVRSPNNNNLLINKVDEIFDYLISNPKDQNFLELLETLTESEDIVSSLIVNSYMDDTQVLGIINYEISILSENAITLNIDPTQFSSEELIQLAKLMQIVNNSNNTFIKEILNNVLNDVYKDPSIFLDFVNTRISNAEGFSNLEDVLSIFTDELKDYLNGVLGLSDQQIDSLMISEHKSEIINYLTNSIIFPDPSNSVEVHSITQFIFRNLINPSQDVKSFINILNTIDEAEFSERLKQIIRVRFRKMNYPNNLNEIYQRYSSKTLSTLIRSSILIESFLDSLPEILQPEDLISRDKMVNDFGKRLELLMNTSRLDKLNQKTFNSMISGTKEEINAAILIQLVVSRIRICKSDQSEVLNLEGLNISSDEFEQIVLPLLSKSQITITGINLSDNNLTEFPDLTQMHGFSQITNLNLKNNAIEKFPDDKVLLENIAHLDLSYNSIADFPDYFEDLTALNLLDLEGNHLSYDAKDILLHLPEVHQQLQISYDQEELNEMLELYERNLSIVFSNVNSDGNIDPSEARRMQDFIEKFGKKYDVFSERRLNPMSRSARAVLYELLCTVKLDLNDPNTQIYREALNRELTELKQAITQEMQDQILLKIQSATGDCATPINDFLIHSEIITWNKGKSNIDNDTMEVLVQRNALMDTILTDPKIKALLPKNHTEKIELVNALLNAVFIRNAEHNPLNILKISGDRDRLEESISHMDYGFDLLSREEHIPLIKEVANLISKPQISHQDPSDTSIRFDFESNKLVLITNLYKAKHLGNSEAVTECLKDIDKLIYSIHERYETDLEFGDDKFKHLFEIPTLAKQLKSKLDGVSDPQEIQRIFNTYMSEIEKEIRDMSQKIKASSLSTNAFLVPLNSPRHRSHSTGQDSTVGTSPRDRSARVRIPR